MFLCMGAFLVKRPTISSEIRKVGTGGTCDYMRELMNLKGRVLGRKLFKFCDDRWNGVGPKFKWPKGSTKYMRATIEIRLLGSKWKMNKIGTMEGLQCESLSMESVGWTRSITWKMKYWDFGGKGLLCPGTTTGRFRINANQKAHNTGIDYSRTSLYSNFSSYNQGDLQSKHTREYSTTDLVLD